MHSRFSNFVLSYRGIKEVDFYLAKSITSVLGMVDDELLFFSIIACSHSLREGHSCLQISEWAGTLRWDTDDEVGCTLSGYSFPENDGWCNHLASLSISPSAEHPIIYENGRLYLRRYWMFEDELTRAIKHYSQTIPFDLTRAKATLGVLFKSESEVDWQMISVANALGKQFSVVTGGPGTGKTTTVTKLLVALCDVFDTPFNIKMVAPTGKAAQRLSESIQGAKIQLAGIAGVTEETLAAIPDEATTIHRLLGVIPKHYQFKYNERNRLTLDILLVDEASMVDLPLMARLFRALPDTARIIFLGDPNQLPSVAAGSVLADVAPVPHPGYSIENGKILADLTGYSLPETSQSPVDYLTSLEKSYRFKSDGGIGRLSKSIISGDSISSWKQLAIGDDEVSLTSETDFDAWLNLQVEVFYRSICKQKDAIAALDMFSRFRILAAMRGGDRGVEAINKSIDRTIKRSLGVPLNALSYHGCPILIRENNYECGLYNGDIGIIWRYNDRLQAAFIDAGQTLRWLSLSRLPAYELVYAMTIHKTQGSEFDKIAIVLPDHLTPILSRELIYTGVTRARSLLEINCRKSVWNMGVKKQVSRNSGLYDKLFMDAGQLTLV